MWGFTVYFQRHQVLLLVRIQLLAKLGDFHAIYCAEKNAKNIHNIG